MGEQLFGSPGSAVPAKWRFTLVEKKARVAIDGISLTIAHS